MTGSRLERVVPRTVAAEPGATRYVFTLDDGDTLHVSPMRLTLAPGVAPDDSMITVDGTRYRLIAAPTPGELDAACAAARSDIDPQRVTRADVVPLHIHHFISTVACTVVPVVRYDDGTASTPFYALTPPPAKGTPMSPFTVATGQPALGGTSALAHRPERVLLHLATLAERSPVTFSGVRFFIATTSDGACVHVGVLRVTNTGNHTALRFNNQVSITSNHLIDYNGHRYLLVAADNPLALGPLIGTLMSTDLPDHTLTEGAPAGEEHAFAEHLEHLLTDDTTRVYVLVNGHPTPTQNNLYAHTPPPAHQGTTQGGLVPATTSKPTSALDKIINRLERVGAPTTVTGSSLIGNSGEVVVRNGNAPTITLNVYDRDGILGPIPHRYRVTDRAHARKITIDFVNREPRFQTAFPNVGNGLLMPTEINGRRYLFFNDRPVTDRKLYGYITGGLLALTVITSLLSLPLLFGWVLGATVYTLLRPEPVVVDSRATLDALIRDARSGELNTRIPELVAFLRDNTTETIDLTAFDADHELDAPTSPGTTTDTGGVDTAAESAADLINTIHEASALLAAHDRPDDAHTLDTLADRVLTLPVTDQEIVRSATTTITKTYTVLDALPDDVRITPDEHDGHTPEQNATATIDVTVTYLSGVREASYNKDRDALRATRNYATEQWGTKPPNPLDL